MLPVDPKFAGAIDTGGIENLAGDGADEVPQHECAKSDLKYTMEDDQGPVGVVEVEPVREPVDRQHQNLKWEHTPTDEGEVNKQVSFESKPSEGKCGQRRQRQTDDECG